MPTLEDHAAAPLVKLMAIGHSGAGKTGALTSLVKAGYQIRILDMDFGLDALVNHVKAECPDKLKNVGYMQFRDKTKIGPAGPMVVGAPKAFTSAVKALDMWEDQTVPSTWGPDYILVIDSFTNLSRAAFAWARQMNPTAKDPRQWYAAAQQVLEDTVATLTSDEFATNLIVMSHIELTSKADGSVEGFASSIGKALGPKLPRFFNTLVAFETSGSGKSVKRVLRTVPTGMLTLKNPAPMKIEAEYPIETGFATLFSKLSGKS